MKFEILFAISKHVEILGNFNLTYCSICCKLCSRGVIGLSMKYIVRIHVPH